jgi:hypothetical protein
MAREYSVTGDGLTISAANIQIHLNPPAGGAAGCGLELLRVWASQRANATSAQQGIAIGYKASVFATVTAATPQLLKASDPASKLVGGTGAVGTAGINASANGAGAENVIVTDNFNVLNGYLWVPTPAETLEVSAGGVLALMAKFTSVPGTTTGWTVGAIYRERG